ncbi:MAG: serine/threonine-protein kinase [Candidatus Zixiibacteriota bacterium]
MNKYSPYILYLVIALLMVVLAVSDFGPVQSLQRSLDDFLCRITAPGGPRPNVTLVDIDQSSLDTYGHWPWDHDLIADLTAAVAAGEPKAILINLDLYEDAAQEAAGRTDVLAGQLAWIKQAVLPYDIAEASFRSNKTSSPDFLFNNSVAIDNPLGVMDEQSSLPVRKVFLPAQKLLQHHPLLGFDYFRPDDDRLVRHQPLIMNYDGYYYPSNSLLAAATYLGVAPGEIKVVEDERIQLGPGRSIPINERGEFYVRFSENVPFARYTAAQILSDDFKRDVLKNKAVVIGQLSGSETEYFNTPVQERVADVLINAAVIENIINGSILAPRTDLVNIFLMILVGLGVVCALVLPRVTLMYRMIILVGALFVLANVSYLMFSSYGMMLPIAFVAIELVLFMIASPFLDTALLSAGRSEEKKPSARAETTKVSRKTQQETPVREIRATAHDPENVATTALTTDSGRTASAAAIDHQTVSLEESSDRPVSRRIERSDSPAPEQTAQLSDSDAAALKRAREKDTEYDPDRQSDSGDSSGAMLTATDLKSLGRYQIHGILGKGAMGTVYRGVDPAINRPVALKTIRLDFVSDPEELAELKERLHREAQAAGKLSHPNIVTIYDVGSEGSLQYIAMEYLEGQTLETMIKKKTRFNYRIIAQMITQICSALQYAHDQGIVHRDIKPANIMVLGDYRVKVMDFGIARVDSNSMTKTGIAMGTPNYISPEQLRGREIDRRADLFSLGVMMYEMLLGKRPFKGENLTSLMYAILNHEPEKPSSVKPQIPLLFDHIIAKALKKEPAERYQKASEIIVDLHDFVESFVH